GVGTAQLAVVSLQPEIVGLPRSIPAGRRPCQRGRAGRRGPSDQERQSDEEPANPIESTAFYCGRDDRPHSSAGSRGCQGGSVGIAENRVMTGRGKVTSGLRLRRPVLDELIAQVSPGGSIVRVRRLRGGMTS